MLRCLPKETTACPARLEALASQLKRCGQAKDLSQGKLLHHHIIECRLDRSTFIGNWLVKMYGDCGCPQDAKVVFDNLKNRNLHSWTMLMTAYAKNGYAREAWDCFERMQEHGCSPNDVSLVCALDACAQLGVVGLGKGRKVHAAILHAGYDGRIIVATALVDMYGKCGSLEDARRVFRKIAHRNVVSWSVMIAACSKNAHCEEALSLFEEMQHHGVKPDRVTFLSALDACTALAALEKGKSIHQAIIGEGLEQQLLISTALINLYGKCRSLEDARGVFLRMRFRDTVAWNAMIGACTKNGEGKEALTLFWRMNSSGVKVDQVTFICALEACDSANALETGRELHAAIVEHGFEREVAIGTSLVDMYGKCGSLEDAKNVFEKMLDRNVVTWNTMISSCNENGKSEEALKLIGTMETLGFELDEFTLVCGLDACASLASLKKGQEIHSCVVKKGYEGDLVVSNALMNMYGKCGSFEDAVRVFAHMLHRDIVSWNAVITSCAHNGEVGKALFMFNAMQFEGFKPDTATFLGVLVACSHTGCINDGEQFFHSMGHTLDLAIGERYACLIDILSHARCFTDVYPNQC